MQDISTIKVYDKDRKRIKRTCAKYDGLTQPELVNLALTKYLSLNISELIEYVKSKKKA